MRVIEFREGVRRDLTSFPVPFDAGSIPSSLGDLKQLTNLNLFGNKLSGECMDE